MAEVRAGQGFLDSNEGDECVQSSISGIEHHGEHSVMKVNAECEPTRTPRRQVGPAMRTQTSLLRRLRQRLEPRRFVSIQLFVVCMCVMASLSSALSTGYVNSVISTIEKRFEIGSFLAGTIAASYEFGCISLLLVTYYGGRRHIPYWIGTGAILMACGAFLFTVPHLITDSYTLRITLDTNRSVPNLCMANSDPAASHTPSAARRSGYAASASTANSETSPSMRASQVEQPGDQQTSPGAKRINMFVQNECDITETQTKNEARYVFVLIIAQMLIGWGGAPNLALGTAYIDAHCQADGGSRSFRAPIYIAWIYACSSLGTVLGFAVGALMLRFRVDYHLPSDYSALERDLSLGLDSPPYTATADNTSRADAHAYLNSASAVWTTMQSTDPRWIGAWWAGFLLFGTLLLLASGCFFLFPKRIDETETEKKRKQQGAILALETVESRLDQLASLDATADSEYARTEQSVTVTVPGAESDCAVQVMQTVGNELQQCSQDHVTSRSLALNAADSVVQTNEIEDASESESEQEDDAGGYAAVSVVRSETLMSTSVSASATASASAASSQSQSALAARSLDSARYGRELRELPRAIVHLFRNAVFFVTALGICFIVSIVSGFVVFLPKHLEQQFALTKSSANLLTGTIAVPGASLGILLGGLLVRRLQLSSLNAVKLSIVLHFATLLCYLLTFALGCDNLRLAGITVRYDFTFDARSDRFVHTDAQTDAHLPPYLNDSLTLRFANRPRAARDVLTFGTQIRDNDYVNVYASLDLTHGTNLSARCNSACRCASQRVEYVCVEELGVTFFSPCYAGCRTELLVVDGRLAAQLSVDAATPQAVAHFESARDNAVRDGATVQRFYVDCDCLDDALRNSLGVADRNASSTRRTTAGHYPFTVSPGICDKKCRMLTPFLVVLFVMTVLVTATQMPLLNVVLRSVAECERTFALGIMFIFVRLSAYLPSPIVFGSVIDTTCLLRRDELELPAEMSCESGGTVLNNKLNRYADKRSSCELYDVVKFRMRYTGLLTIYEFASLFCFVVVLFILRRHSTCTVRCPPRQADQNADTNCVQFQSVAQPKTRRARQHPVTRFLVQAFRFPRRRRRTNVELAASSTDALRASSF